jgi:hypothetical protein
MLVPSLSWQIIYRFPQEVFFSENSHTHKAGGGVFCSLAGCDQEAYDPFCAKNDHPGEYVELQNGPAASQRHSFPLDARSSYEWTEYLAAFRGDVKKLQDKDYDVATLRCSPQIAFLSPCLALVAFGAVCMHSSH